MDHIKSAISFIQERINVKEEELLELRERMLALQMSCTHPPGEQELIFSEECVKWEYYKCHNCDKLYYTEK